jgi:hypothetical protein
MRAKWTTRDIPDQSGRVAVVTGANSGIGLRVAETPAEGAHAVHEEGAPLCGRPFLVDIVRQRPLPNVGEVEPTVACCWMSYTQS